MAKTHFFSFTEVSSFAFQLMQCFYVIIYNTVMFIIFLFPLYLCFLPHPGKLGLEFLLIHCFVIWNMAAVIDDIGI